MSVLSKALRVAVVSSLITVPALMSGCATSSQNNKWASANTDVANADVTNADAGSQEMAAAEVEAAPRELMASTESNLSLSLTEGNGYTKFLIGTPSLETPYEVSQMENPSRLVLDISGVKGSANKTVPVATNDYINSVRVGAHADKTRVVLDLSALALEQGSTVKSIAREGGKIAVTFRPVNMETAKNKIAPKATQVAQVENVIFYKTKESAGEVTVNVTGKAPYELRRTSSNEYALVLRNSTVGEQAQAPQIAPASAPGIRSTRAVQDGNDVLVRMFVDPGVDLRAFSKGSAISVIAKAPTIDTLTEARGQMKPEGTTEAAAANTEAPADITADGSSDETARRNPTGIPSADGSKIYTGRLISLDLQETDIDNALRIIAEVSNLNIIASDDVTGKVTLRLVDVPWDQALDVILKTNGLDQVTEGNVIRIAPVGKLREEREALREAKKAAENLEDLKVEYKRISYARASDIKEQVESVLSERGSVAVDDRTNQLIVKDINKGQDSARDLIKKLDLRTPQVLLETQVVEASRTILRDLGFQWNFAYNQGPAWGNATGYNFPNSVVLGGGTTGQGGAQAVNFPAALGADSGAAISALLDSADGTKLLSFRLSALEQEGKVRVISRPQVATINNKEAQIKSVEKVRIRLPDSGLSVATGQGASAQGGAASAFEEIDVGITLRVTPQASPDYFVLLDIFAKSSTFGDRIVDNIPSTREREATSTILVKSGQTFALGGVYRIEETDRLNGLPFFKDIPFIGAAFRRSLMDKQDQELIFFITPHIVEGSFDPGAM